MIEGQAENLDLYRKLGSSGWVDVAELHSLAISCTVQDVLPPSKYIDEQEKEKNTSTYRCKRKVAAQEKISVKAVEDSNKLRRCVFFSDETGSEHHTT